MLGIIASCHCIQFQGNLINQTLEKNKKPSFEPDFGTFGPNSGRQFFFKNLALSVTIYYDQLSLSTISEKINDPILRKRSDERTDGQMD